MNKIILEYVWLDGYKTPNLRSKIKVMDWDTLSKPVTLGSIPEWNFDGSSTRQAPGNDSECLLKPARLYKGLRRQYLVLCEVMNPDGSPHRTNQRMKTGTSPLQRLRRCSAFPSTNLNHLLEPRR